MEDERPNPRGPEPATGEFLDWVQRRDRRNPRTIGFATPGSDDLEYLDYWGANANVGGQDLTHILLREDPRMIEVWEEFLHGTQKRLGIIDRSGIDGAEVHVKQFMIRHARLMGLSPGDVEVLLELLGEHR